jgi:hypothetical protein
MSNTFLWIQDFLSHRMQEVQLEGHKSTTADVLSGVPQGTVLGPLLFLLFGLTLLIAISENR